MKRIIFLISYALFFSLIVVSIPTVILDTDLNNEKPNQSEIAIQAPFERYTKEWIKNPSFDLGYSSWYSNFSGDESDVNATITSGEANFELSGIKHDFSLIANPPSASDWTAVDNPEFPSRPQVYGINEKGCVVSHIFNDQTANQNPSIHWDRNVTMPVNMSDYIITSINITSIVNATVSLDLDREGDSEARDDDLYSMDQYSIGDYIKFYVLISDIEKKNIFQIASLQPEDLGAGNPTGFDYLPNTYMIPLPEEVLKFYFSSVLSLDNYNFTITLGMRLNIEDNIADYYDIDTFTELVIKYINISFSYVKKMDQLNTVSWNQVGNQLSGENVEILNASLNFKYKIDTLWPTALSINSELKIFINNFEFTQSIKLSSMTTYYQFLAAEGFQITNFIEKDINVSLSIQIFLADEFNLDKPIKISFDEVSLLISYDVYQEQVPRSYYFIYLILVVFFGVIVILSGLILRSYVLIPRKKEKLEALLSRTQKFKDIMNLESIIVVQKGSGVPIFYKHFSIINQEREVLFPGFAQALTIMAEEITEKQILNKKVPEGVEKLLEFDFNIFNCLIVDKGVIRLIMILKEKASQRLKQISAEFTLSLFSSLNQDLMNYNGHLKAYKKKIALLMEQYINLSYKGPFMVNPNFSTVVRKRDKDLSKMELRILNVIESHIREIKQTFLLSTLLDLTSEKDKDLVIDAIESIIQHEIIVPFLVELF
ncbi:MAG: hypothetical protein ACXAEX_08440 [Promethearchaeota archaeon]|jgi:hypothetical protein